MFFFNSELYEFLFKSHDLKCFKKLICCIFCDQKIRTLDYVSISYQYNLSKTGKHLNSFLSYCSFVMYKITVTVLVIIIESHLFFLSQGERSNLICLICWHILLLHLFQNHNAHVYPVRFLSPAHRQFLQVYKQ